MDKHTAAILINLLMSWFYSATPTKFAEVFGPDMGLYLWSKYEMEYRRRPHLFWGYLDSSNQAALIAALLERLD